jgi:hypothetical protein
VHISVAVAQSPSCSCPRASGIPATAAAHLPATAHARTLVAPRLRHPCMPGTADYYTLHPTCSRHSSPLLAASCSTAYVATACSYVGRSSASRPPGRQPAASHVWQQQPRRDATHSKVRQGAAHQSVCLMTVMQHVLSFPAHYHATAHTRNN